MLQQHPAADGLFLFRRNDPSVEEIFIDGGEDEASAGEQLTEVFVTWIGEIGHVVIAVDDQSEGKRSVAFRVPDAGVERHFVEAEAPISPPEFLLPTLEILKKQRSVNCFGLYRHRFAVFGAPNVGAVSIKDGQNLVRTSVGGVRQGEGRRIGGGNLRDLQ